ncbi:MAG: SpoIIE family protein phosphatase [Methylococcales bacterium]|nr:SpoIIE family protein phosphatase [Methylococcales bacterium]
MNGNKRFISIRLRLMFALLGMIFCLQFISTLLQYFDQRTQSKQALERRVFLIKSHLNDKGNLLAKSLLKQSEESVASFNFFGITKILEEAVLSDKALDYAILMNKSRIAFAHTAKPQLQSQILEEQSDYFAANVMTRQIKEYDQQGNTVLEFIEPLVISTEPWGVLRLGISLKQLQNEIDQSTKNSEQRIKNIILKSILTALILAVLGLAIVIVIANKLSHPIIALTKSTRQLAKGDFSSASQLKVKSNDEIGLLSNTFSKMANQLQNSYQQLEEYSKNLEHKVEERTLDLQNTNHQLQQSQSQLIKSNLQIQNSIEYASNIQNSLLPSTDSMNALFNDYFVWWQPRDIVGGDIYLLEKVNNGFLVMVFDCTGHGVPGAFMTMVTSSGIRHILDKGITNDPGAILCELNNFIKNTLKQDKSITNTTSDDGLDGSICYINTNEQKIVFAGAKSSLLMVSNGELTTIKGNNKSIGYKRSTYHYSYNNHVINYKTEDSFYLYSDGCIDQNGDEDHFCFGQRKFRKELLQNITLPFAEQKQKLVERLTTYQGEQTTRDDIVVLGFRL